MHRWVSFDLFRTAWLPRTQQLKPLQMYQHGTALAEADWVLFPEYWQLNTLVHAYRARVFPSVATYRIGHDKVEMTRALQAVVPAYVPQTWIQPNTPTHAEALWQEQALPFVAKLPRSSRGAGVWRIENRADWLAYLALTDVLYVQEYLPIDRDLRIVIVGDQVLAAYWRLQGSDGFHNNLARGGEVWHGPVPQAALDLVRHVAARLDVNHAGFDVAMVGQHPYLLEFNRLFGNQGVEGGDKRIQQAICDYLLAHSDPQSPDAPVSSRPPLPEAA